MRREVFLEILVGAAVENGSQKSEIGEIILLVSFPLHPATMRRHED